MKEVLDRLNQFDDKFDRLDNRLDRLDNRLDLLDTRMNQRFDRLEIAILDLAGRVVAQREVEEIKARMSGGISPAASTPSATSSR